MSYLILAKDACVRNRAAATGPGTFRATQVRADGDRAEALL